MRALTLFFLTCGLCAGSMVDYVSAKELTKADAEALVSSMGNGTELVIPAEYTEFASYAFKGCKKIHSVKILGEVKNISREMFSKCVNLHTVSLPEGVERIEREAFNGCTALKNINFPVSVRFIGDEAFSGAALEDVTLLNIETIGYAAFMFCNQLKYITLPYSVKYIGQSAFSASDNGILSMGKRYIHVLGCGNDQEKIDKVNGLFLHTGEAPTFFDSELARQNCELEAEIDNLRSELNMSYEALTCPIANKPRKEVLVNAIREKAQKMDDKAAELSKNAAAYRDMLK